ncbi:hypothetical protein FGRMN_10381 [Fusarium graminum]|nr:hypothetical protein FGRMN_10381 [Fusarium graminum]
MILLQTSPLSALFLCILSFSPAHRNTSTYDKMYYKELLISMLPWIMGDPIRVGFGHIQGPPATAKARNVPYLRGYARVLFIIDADPDYSAPFALALMAVTTFAGHMAGHRSGKSMRVVTLSWEKIHRITHELFSHWSQPIEFTITDMVFRQIPLIVPVGDHETSDEATDKYARSLNDPSTQLRLRFEEHHLPFATPREKSPLVPPWCEMKIVPYRMLRLTQHCRRPHMSSLPGGLQGAVQLFSVGHLMVSTSKTCSRQIFDLRTRQTVRVTVWASLSERHQQMSWVYRTVTPTLQATILSRPDFLDNSDNMPTRRMRITDDQVGGFLAALTEFVDWPESFAVLLQIIKRRFDQNLVMTDMHLRLTAQSLMNAEDTRLGMSLKLPHPQAFYQILQHLDYDHRLAYFLCQESSDPRVTMVKVELASFLTENTLGFVMIEPRPFTKEELATLSQGLNEARKGFSGQVARHGTTWAAIAMTRLASRVDGFQFKPESIRCGVFNGLMTLWPARMRDAEMMARSLRQVLTNNSIPVSEHHYDADGTQLGSLTVSQYNEICEHLLRAYAHQVAVIYSRDKDNTPQIRDLLSQQPLQANIEVQLIPCFEEMFGQDGNGYPAMGVYTRLDRGEKGQTILGDWTFIPRSVWTKLIPEIAVYRGEDTPKAPWPLPWLTENEDETLGVEITTI